MHILMLNQYFPPDTSATALIARAVAEALAEKHTVTVQAGRPSYNPERYHSYYLFKREYLGKVLVERVGSTTFHRRRMAGRVSNFLSYLGLVLILALISRPKPDVVIAMTDPPVISLIGAICARARGCRFVYNVRDLHPDTAVASGMVRPGLLVKLWERLNVWALRHAHMVIVLGEDMRQRILSKGVSPERVVVVRDGADPIPTPKTTDHPTVAQIRGTFPFVVEYAGNIGAAGAWDTLFEAAQRLEGEDIGFVFVGEGSQKEYLSRRAKGMANVRFLPFRPTEEIPYVLASADLHIVTMGQGLEGLVVPSKLYPILMAHKPVLAVAPLESDLARIVEEHQCGLVVAPDDPEGVAKAILWARKHSQDDLAVMGRRAGEASILFDRRRLLKEFVLAVELASTR